MTWYVTGALALGGIGTLASRNRELIRRWLTWVCTAIVVAGCLRFGGLGAAILAASLGVVAAVEYAGLAYPSPDRAHRRGIISLPPGRLGDFAVIAAPAAALPFVAWLDAGALGRALAAALLLAALVPVLSGDAEGGARRAAVGLCGITWLSPLTAVVILRNERVLCLIFAVALADVGAWCAGRLLRGPFLSPLSPAKRWTGAVGGAVAGCGALALTGALTVPFALAVAVGAPLGDLVESMVKRSAGVKDAGAWLPGFGGMLDRIDSLLVALAVAVII